MPLLGADCGRVNCILRLFKENKMSDKITTSVLALLVAASILGCGGRSANTIPLNHAPSAYASCFTLEQKGSAYFPCPTNPLELIVTETGDKILVTLQARIDTSLAELLYILHFDSYQFTPISVEMGKCLGDENAAIHTSYAEVPGEIALAEVMIGLEFAQLETGNVFATVEFERVPFTVHPYKVLSELDTAQREVSWRLRKEAEFVNYDVPFEVEREGSLIELTWEEALNHDADNNGEVYIQDLTPLRGFKSQVQHMV
jgi:hypothetical protein